MRLYCLRKYKKSPIQVILISHFKNIIILKTCLRHHDKIKAHISMALQTNFIFFFTNFDTWIEICWVKYDLKKLYKFNYYYY